MVYICNSITVTSSVSKFELSFEDDCGDSSIVELVSCVLSDVLELHNVSSVFEPLLSFFSQPFCVVFAVMRHRENEKKIV